MASTVPSPLARVLEKLQPGPAALLLSGVTSLCLPLGLPDTPRLEGTPPPLLCKPPPNSGSRRGAWQSKLIPLGAEFQGLS